MNTGDITEHVFNCGYGNVRLTHAQAGRLINRSDYRFPMTIYRIFRPSIYRKIIVSDTQTVILVEDIKARFEGQGPVTNG